MSKYQTLFLLLLLLFVSCERKQDVRREDQPPATTPQVQELLKKYTSSWMQIPGVVGTAEGREDELPCVLVYVVNKTDELAARLPDSVGGFAVFIREVGEPRRENTR